MDPRTTVDTKQGGGFSALSPWRWPLTVVALALIALIGYLLSLRQLGDSAQLALEGFRGIAEGFRRGTITETFHAALPELTSEAGGSLDVATLNSVETFTRSDDRRILWDWVSLGKTVTEVRVPVSYRYHIRFRDHWRIDVSGQTCIVYAPPPRPSLPPAIDTSEIQLEVDHGWLRFDTLDQTSELLKKLTPVLNKQASDPRRMELVRERARRTVAEFIRDWLAREKQWGEESFRYIFVVFSDEEEYPGLPAAPFEGLPPKP